MILENSHTGPRVHSATLERVHSLNAGAVQRSDARSEGNRIGILIVAYNAVSTIAKVLKRIPDDVWTNVEEVVIFDDASHDHTYELVVGMKMLAGLEKLTVIRNDENLGYGGNQKLGYRYFIDKGFDVVVLLHGDGQYAPEILSRLYAPIIAGEADAVFGSRMMGDEGGALKGGMPLYKYVGNRILSFFENRALDLRLTEFHSGYRAYRVAALKRLDFSHMTDVFHFDTQIIIKLHHQGLRIVEVPIPTYYGSEICYVNGLRYARDVFASIVRYKRTCRSLACYPEYKEYFINYPAKQSGRSSYRYFLKWIGRDHDVLDVGCGEGFFSEEVAKRGNRVSGIDLMAAPKNAASLQQYIHADLANGLAEATPQLATKRFDRVLLQDILEHVVHPAKLLGDCHELLKPSGEVLISVPNVANVTVRLALLFGRFEYTQRGILDRTHVRFFTRRSIRELISATGYDIVSESVSIMPFELALGLKPDRPMVRGLNGLLGGLTRLFPRLLGYQLLYVVRSRTAGSTGHQRRLDAQQLF